MLHYAGIICANWRRR